MSLIVSILYFQNPFTVYHWFGSALVFCGTLIFSEVPQKLWALFVGDVQEKAEKTKEE